MVEDILYYSPTVMFHGTPCLYTSLLKEHSGMIVVLFIFLITKYNYDCAASKGFSSLKYFQIKIAKYEILNKVSCQKKAQKRPPFNNYIVKYWVSFEILIYYFK